MAHRASVPRVRGVLPALRGTAYVLTSLASLLFIAIAIYTYVQFNRTQTTLEDAVDHLLVQVTGESDVAAARSRRRPRQLTCWRI